MRISLLFVALAALCLTASCVRSPMLSNSVDVAPSSTGTNDETSAAGFIEMPPLYIDARERYGQKIKTASTTAIALCRRQLDCPSVRVLRADLYRRTDGTLWTVVRLNACGEERVYEQTPQGWNDATARLR